MPTLRIERRRGARAGALALVAAGALMLSACQTAQFIEVQETGSLHAFRDTDRHPIVVERGKVELSVDVPGYTRGLSPRQAGQVRAFLADYNRLGEGELVMLVPSGTANEAAAMAAVTELRDMTVRAGIARTALRYAPYGGQGRGGEPPIVLSFERYFANPSECGNWPINIAHDPYNKPYAEFGCATQNNLAAMISDPRDLVRHRPMTPADSERRRVMLEAYRQGETTAADRSEAESGAVSEVE